MYKARTDRARGRGLVPALAALVLGGICVAPARAEFAPLYVIPTEASGVGALPAAAAVRLEVEAQDPVALARLLGVPAPAMPARSIDFTLDRYPVVPEASGRSWLESSFVIDHAEPAVRELHAAWRRGTKPSRDPAALTEFVAAQVTPAHDRGWDIASTVARIRRGDCSEMAVVTAALARAEGWPARVIVGVALVSLGERHAAFGHAWAEIRRDGRWVAADAALRNATGDIRYLPFGAIEDEGPGFGLGLMRLSTVWIRRVRVLGAAADAAAGVALPAAGTVGGRLGGD